MNSISWCHTAHKGDACRAAQKSLSSNGFCLLLCDTELFALRRVLKASKSLGVSVMGVFHTLSSSMQKQPEPGGTHPSERHQLRNAS